MLTQKAFPTLNETKIALKQKLNFPSSFHVPELRNSQTKCVQTSQVWLSRQQYVADTCWPSTGHTDWRSTSHFRVLPVCERLLFLRNRLYFVAHTHKNELTDPRDSFRFPHIIFHTLFSTRTQTNWNFSMILVDFYEIKLLNWTSLQSLFIIRELLYISVI